MKFGIIEFFSAGVPETKTSYGSEAWRSVVSEAAEKSALSQPLANCAVRVEMEFFFPRNTLAGENKIFKRTTPDLDNCAKLALDAITDSGIWKDDNIVAELNLSKKYETESCGPGLRVKIFLIDAATQTVRKIAMSRMGRAPVLG